MNYFLKSYCKHLLFINQYFYNFVVQTPNYIPNAMKNYLVKFQMTILILMVAQFITINFIHAQSQGPNSPANATELAYSCLACPGTDWTNWTNIEHNDTSSASSSIFPYQHCWQSACY